tara:strand:+ start:1087 stop:1323 length:237 start_codon:yes stop_codon:yes gene_type:complete
MAGRRFKITWEDSSGKSHSEGFSELEDALHQMDYIDDYVVVTLSQRGRVIRFKRVEDEEWTFPNMQESIYYDNDPMRI